MNLYVISGVTGMTGNELARQLTGKGNKVLGFDNFCIFPAYGKGFSGE